MLEEILEDRKKKLEEYKKVADPYPARVRRTHRIAKALADFDPLQNSKKEVTITGRLLALRDQGKIIFGNLADGSGKIQTVFNGAEMEGFEIVKKTFDIGDFLEVSGLAYTTTRGEKSVLVKSARIISKSRRPLPGDWYGLGDIETRLRKRYMDLLINPEVREMFVKKSLFWDTVRNYLKKEDFLEVETSVLEPVPGGAEAEPFVTHH